MKNNTKNNTNKTMKQLFLAASVALTMGVASATSVPGIGTDVFEFTKPGVDSNANVVGLGVNAITNMNDILAAVGSTGGSTLDADAFWGSSVAKTEVDVFEYDAAAPMIEELIFVVKGEAFDRADQTYKDAASVNTYELGGSDGITVVGTSTARADFLAKTSNTGTGGTYLDGKLSHTKAKAIELMEMLNFTVTGNSLAWESNNSLTPLSSNADNEPVLFTGPHAAIDINDVTGGTYVDEQGDGVMVYQNDSNVEVATAAASLNKQAFIDANNLVGLIAAELKTGYILDVDKAAVNLAAIAGHHTGFLSASLVNKAHDLKAVIKNIGYLEASVGVGKGARVACVDTGGSTNKTLESCKAIGHKFQSLSSQVLSVADAGTAADGFAATITAINAFATNIISFNNTVDGFDAATQAGLINDQFGTITVNTDSDLYDELVAGNAPTESDIAGLTAADSVEFDLLWDSEMTLFTDLGDDNAIGGTGDNADTATSIILN